MNMMNVFANIGYRMNYGTKIQWKMVHYNAGLIPLLGWFNSFTRPSRSDTCKKYVFCISLLQNLQ